MISAPTRSPRAVRPLHPADHRDGQQRQDARPRPDDDRHAVGAQPATHARRRARRVGSELADRGGAGAGAIVMRRGLRLGGLARNHREDVAELDRRPCARRARRAAGRRRAGGRCGGSVGVEPRREVREPDAARVQRGRRRSGSPRGAASRTASGARSRRGASACTTASAGRARARTASRRPWSRRRRCRPAAATQWMERRSSAGSGRCSITSHRVIDVVAALGQRRVLDGAAVHRAGDAAARDLRRPRRGLDARDLEAGVLGDGEERADVAADVEHAAGRHELARRARGSR